jgi:cobalt transporter subunit CbtA
MFTRIVLVALITGLVAGGLVAILQQSTVVPLILEAEVYERAAAHAATQMPGMDMSKTGTATTLAAGSPASSGHDMTGLDEEPWTGQPRVLVTTISLIGATFGWTLILLALVVMAGDELDWRRALVWGAAGFAAVGLAPAMGLAPELPGAAVTDLTMRQLWWMGTAISTASALWLILRRRSHATLALAVLLLLAPHVIGAPHAEKPMSTVPAELASEFTARSLVLQSVLWLLLSATAGYLWLRWVGDPAERAA